MQTETPRMLLEARYEQAAQDYLRRLPLEHFMESTPHARQRKITLESLDLVMAVRADFQVFNELLVQYKLPRRKRLGQVVPDNMVVIHDQPIKADGSYAVPLQPIGPFWVLEYVSKGNRRKDYKDNRRRYEHELKVPYYLLFNPEKQELTLYRHTGERYGTVKPNKQGRSALPEVDIEVGLLDGWVRFWHEGKLLPLPGELLQERDEARRELAEQKRAREALERELVELRARKNGKN